MGSSVSTSRHQAVYLFRHFYRRELTGRFTGNLTGWLWFFIHPLILLGVNTVVFGYFMRARFEGVPEGTYVYFLGLALWPWLAFQEAVSRAAQVIPANAALIKKSAFPRVLLAVASVAASLTVHFIGYSCFLVIALIAGQIDVAGLPVLLLVCMVHAVWILALAILLAGVQPFVRDLETALPSLLMVWMYATPIIYPLAAVPTEYRGWLLLNPLTGLIDLFRQAVGTANFQGSAALLGYAVAGGLALLFATWVFRRVEPHFEDFL